MNTLTLLVVACCLFSYTLNAVISIDIMGGSTSDWTAIDYPLTSRSDFEDDQQTGHVPSDLVGDVAGNQVAFYKTYDDGGGTATLDDDYIGFRIRMAAPDGPDGAPNWDSNLLIGIDVGGEGAADIFVITTQKSGGYIRYYSVDSTAPGQNVSPSTTNVSVLNPSGTAADVADASGFIWERSPTSPFFDYSAVDAFTDQYIADNGAGATDNIDGLSRNNKDDTDFFLSFQVDMLTLIEAVRLSTGAVLDGSTSLSFLVGTSIQDNAFNQDLNGQNGNNDPNDPTSGNPYGNNLKDLTWDQLGASTDAYTASGTEPVPEPAAYGLVFGVFALGFVANRRRK